MNTKSIVIGLAGGALALTLLFGSCTELKKDLQSPTSPSLQIHEPGWNDSTSSNFHGVVLKQQQFNLNTCVTCHARSFSGGTSGVACSKCHQSYPHNAGWAADTSSAEFHGKYLLVGMGQLGDCAKCHGPSYNGGTSGVSCYKCHSSYPHKPGWTDPLVSQSHGSYLKAKSYQLAECTACHGVSFEGGTSGKSCFTCHASFPHNQGWVGDTSATAFHGKYLLTGKGQVSDCAKCHGASFNGGTSGISCYTCHSSYPHQQPGWSDPSSPSSHGKYLKAKQWNVNDCASCHGTSFTGGTSGKACYTCHASFPHGPKFQAPGGHQGYLRSNTYPLAQCQTCHGSSYTGGSVVNVSCSALGCHVDRNGTAKTPEACNTCHGVFSAPANDFLSSAPPKSVLGDSLITVRGVGAHQKHLLTGSIGKAVKCQECHTVPAQVFSNGHVDSPPPAEVAFNDTLARLVTAGGTFRPGPRYDPVSLKCSDTYCHGNWRARVVDAPLDYQYAYTDSIIEGANAAPVWTGGSGQVACGTCHGLPPKGHISVSFPRSCGNCHVGVVNSSGAIIDPSKHINGKINVFSNERRF